MTRTHSKQSFKDTVTLIHSEEANELEYWTFKWKISKSQLFEAMRETKSNVVSTVEDYLKGRNLI